MTTITVLDKGNVPTGPFTREQIAAKLQSGEVSLTDLAFAPGFSQWTLLRDVLAKIDGTSSVSIPITAPAPPAYSYAASMQPPSHLVYAGFWLRFVAYLIDALILGIPMTLIIIVFVLMIGGFAVAAGAFQSSFGNHADEDGAAFPVGLFLLEMFFAVFSMAVSWLYFALMESSSRQATYGKLAMGLKVTGMEGTRITFAHATGRFFSKVITGMVPFGIGYIMAGLTQHKQALHDLIASTLVVRDR